MAKFSFHKEQFKTNDPVWKAEREALFDKLLPIIGSSKTKKNATLKRYFLKGEWTLHSEYDLDFVTKLSFLPELKKEHYFSVMKEVPWEDGKREFRHVFLYWLMAGSQLNELSISDTLIDDFYTLSVDGLTHYSEESIEIEGITHERFPWHVDREQNNGFFMRYLSVAHEWLTEKHNQSKSGLTHFMPHWFSALSYLKWKGFTKGGMRKRIFELFTAIQHYIPEHKSNPAAAQKQLFVDEFKRCVLAHGLVKPELIEIWQEASENSEEKWVDELYECDPEKDPEVWQSWNSGPFEPLVHLSQISCQGTAETIRDLYVANNLGHPIDKVQDITVAINDILTPEFIAELPLGSADSPILASLYRIELNEKHMGTDKTRFYLDLLELQGLPESTEVAIPRILILERATEHYQADLARRYCAYRSYMIDDIKYHTGKQFVRYLGFTHHPSGVTIPPDDGAKAWYERVNAFKFKNVDYSPLKLSGAAFILNDPEAIDY
ncbi:hypothetical protein [Pseudoalteromonas spongiae]|uniref:hypothetical protein n=1 Tax=Pseudoalteromonas spongiae TaxID=298657 RepID=UPI00110A5692|nr:hypothetical protein [Pseudoalteromonas spongiae]TMO83087.1 hypothetical protein CWC15_16645 [Pseudoalteromonas spongiae]